MSWRDYLNIVKEDENWIVRLSGGKLEYYEKKYFYSILGAAVCRFEHDCDECVYYPIYPAKREHELFVVPCKMQSCDHLPELGEKLYNQLKIEGEI